jgi:hypothetical protein
MRQIPDSGSPEQIFFEVSECTCAYRRGATRSLIKIRGIDQGY